MPRFPEIKLTIQLSRNQLVVLANLTKMMKFLPLSILMKFKGSSMKTTTCKTKLKIKYSNKKVIKRCSRRTEIPKPSSKTSLYLIQVNKWRSFNLMKLNLAKKLILPFELLSFKSCALICRP